MTRRPPDVVVVWTDATDRTLECRYDADNPSEIKNRVHLRKGRETRGMLVYQDNEKTILAHDYDPPEENDDDRRPEVGNFTVIPTGWIETIRHTRHRRRGSRDDVRGHAGAAAGAAENGTTPLREHVVSEIARPAPPRATRGVG